MAGKQGIAIGVHKGSYYRLRVLGCLGPMVSQVEAGIPGVSSARSQGTVRGFQGTDRTVGMLGYHTRNLVVICGNGTLPGV